jgi:hypothetical protein
VKLSHLLVMVLGTLTNTILLGWLLSRAGLQAPLQTLQWLAMPAAMFIALLLAWPVSRFLGLSPLMILAGPCPGCRSRPPGWWGTKSGRARLTLICGACGERVELWLTRRPPAGQVLEAGHVFRLRWPEFLGLWYRVH